MTVGGVDQHAGHRARAVGLIEDTDLEVDEVDVLQVRVYLADRVAQRPVQRVDRAIALGRSHVALASHPDLDRGLGGRVAVGVLLDDDPPGLEFEQRLIGFICLTADEQLERSVGRLELETGVLELLDAVDDPLGQLPVRHNAHLARPLDDRGPAREL
jgi:hypothetical protein